MNLNRQLFWKGPDLILALRSVISSHSTCALLLTRYSRFTSQSSILGRVHRQILSCNTIDLRILVSCVCPNLAYAFEARPSQELYGAGREVRGSRRLTRTWLATPFANVSIGKLLPPAGRRCGYSTSRDGKIARLQRVVMVSRDRSSIRDILTCTNTMIRPQNGYTFPF